MSNLELHVISTGKQELKQFADIAGRIHDQVTAIHLREKTSSAEEILRGVQFLLEAGVPSRKIRINGCMEAALSARVGGIHLPGGQLRADLDRVLSLGSLQIGASVHNVQEAETMERLGVHYLLYGHVYATKSKPGLAPRGINGLAEVIRQVSIPVVAIGGITPERIRDVIQCGAGGVAVISGILEAANPVAAAKHYGEQLQAAGERMSKITGTEEEREVKL